MRLRGILRLIVSCLGVSTMVIVFLRSSVLGGLFLAEVMDFLESDIELNLLGACFISFIFFRITRSLDVCMITLFNSSNLRFDSGLFHN